MHRIVTDLNHNTQITNVMRLTGTNISHSTFTEIIDAMLLDGKIN